FWDAFWATMLGSVILEVISFLLGYAGAREGLSTSLLSRYTGFGKHGSTILAFVIGVSSIGWFGVQNAVFADGLVQAFGGSWPVVAALTGLGVTLLVIFGFRVLSITASIAVPLFFIAVAFGIYAVLKEHSISELIASAPAGEPLSIGVAATMVAGGFIVGAIITPDYSRFAKSGSHVFWMTMIGTIIGELGINMIAVLMALAARTSDVANIMMSLTGWLGAIMVIFSTVKINNLNLYSASLGFTNMFNTIFNLKLNRGKVTLGIGIIGTILSIMGILDYFNSFLVLLGVALPPFAGIMVVDYFILRSHRKELDESKEKGELPGDGGKLHPMTLISWATGFAVGYFVTLGIPSINSLVSAGVLYYVSMLIVKRKMK
ncbi:cytosine permease, partial [Neobacillus niacini]|uniref:purine-cytosine permease family protein n=1 Tax=Neobacillus niacini TaxID=86668 RepID=UPI002FFDF0EC